MSTQAGARLWGGGQDGGRLGLAQIHFPLFPCGNASHPPLRGTADRRGQDHSEPRRANVRRRVHRSVGPLTTRQDRCYSRTLEAENRAVAITQAVGSCASRHSFGFCLSTVFV